MTSNVSVATPSGEIRPYDLASRLGERVLAAARAAFDVDLSDPLIRPSTAGRGTDYQCNVAMSLAKRLGMQPREVATRLLEELDVSELSEPPTIGGPGFVNFAIRSEWLGSHVTELASDSRLGVPTVAQSRRVVIDLSSPNVAKEMHVGHLRSTIIGNALLRILRFVGHEVIPQNHLGDWGTPFGMLLEYTHRLGWESEQSDADRSISDLNDFYQQARILFDSDPDFADRARERVVALQGGDENSLRLWRQFIAESERHFSQVYELLGIDLSPQDSRGESFYNPMLADTVAELERLGAAQVSDGALCVFPEGFTNADGDPMPLIVRKSDGGYTYDTTDLAAVRYRVNDLKADYLIYVVGLEQRLHFAMVFAAAQQVGWLPEGVTAEHVGFGLVLGEDGKRFRTRAGGTVKLIDLVTEAVDRAAQIVRQRSDLTASEQEVVARQVGTGAVKYADLSSDRERDYTFSWTRMLAMEGNTSVYLQYANARIQSVLRRADVEGVLPDESVEVVISEPAERNLALSLDRFAPIVNVTADSLSPHRLCGYLYELATAFSQFYENCPILGADNDQVRASRIRLAELTSRAIKQGLWLLGIEAPARL